MEKRTPKEIVVRYEDGTEKVIGKGFAVYLREQDEKTMCISSEMANLSGEEYVWLIRGMYEGIVGSSTVEVQGETD